MDNLTRIFDQILHESKKDYKSKNNKGPLERLVGFCSKCNKELRGNDWMPSDDWLAGNKDMFCFECYENTETEEDNEEYGVCAKCGVKFGQFIWRKETIRGLLCYKCYEGLYGDPYADNEDDVDEYPFNCRECKCPLGADEGYIIAGLHFCDKCAKS